MALMLVLAAILTMASCGDGYVEYKNDKIGLAFTLPDDMEEPYESRNKLTSQNKDETVLFVVNWFTIEALEYKLGENFSIAAYVNFAIYDLGIADAAEVVYNNDGTRAVFDISTAENEAQVPQYLYHLILKGETHLYVVQFICSEDDRQTYEAEFRTLAAKVYSYKAEE